MSPETSDVVERLYEVLVDEIRRNRPELLDEGFTVAEIYQNLVPYRTHRDRIGTEMNGDYEHALLRLLAGEGGYVELDSDAARERFQDELDSLSPDTGVYRNFAACEVTLNEDRLPGEDGSGSAGEPQRAEPEPTTAPEAGEREGESWLSELEGNGGPEAPDEPSEPPAGDPAGAGSPELSGPDAPPEETDQPAASSASGPGLELVGDDEEDEPPARQAEPDSACRWCRERLPNRDDLQFCPFCGSRVDLVPCPECGTELEEGWLFCVACGAGVSD